MGLALPSSLSSSTSSSSSSSSSRFLFDDAAFPDFFPEVFFGLDSKAASISFLFSGVSRSHRQEPDINAS